VLISLGPLKNAARHGWVGLDHAVANNISRKWDSHFTSVGAFGAN